MDGVAGQSETPDGEAELAALASAEPEFKALLAAGIGPAQAWLRRGTQLMRENRMPDAAAALERSLSLTQGQPNTWLLLGLARANQGSEDSAERAYRKVIEQEPGSALVW